MSVRSRAAFNIRLRSFAVEVAGTDEEEPALREKAEWYLKHGVSTVWIVLPDTNEVLFVRNEGVSRFTGGDHLPEMSELPGLRPEVAEFSTQLRASQ